MFHPNQLIFNDQLLCILCFTYFTNILHVLALLSILFFLKYCLILLLSIINWISIMTSRLSRSQTRLYNGMPLCLSPPWWYVFVEIVYFLLYLTNVYFYSFTCCYVQLCMDNVYVVWILPSMTLVLIRWWPDPIMLIIEMSRHIDWCEDVHHPASYYANWQNKLFIYNIM